MDLSKLKNTILISFVLIAVQATAQIPDFSFNHLTISDGLVSNRISSIIQDSLGFMWFGTVQGLSMYDGYSFRNYTSNPDDSKSLSDNSINCLLEDKNQNLWIGTNKGLNYFNRATQEFTVFHFDKSNQNSSSSKGVKVLALDTENPDYVWVGTSHGLYYFNTRNSSYKPHYSFNHSDSLSNDNIFAIYPDGEKIWISTRYNLHIYSKRTGAFKRCYGLDVRWAQDIKRDSRNNIWICSRYAGIYLLPNGNIDSTIVNFTRENSGIINNSPSYIEEDKHGNYYISYRNGGINYYHYKKDTFYTATHDKFNPYSLNTNSLVCLYKSRDGTIWAGTFNKGINFLNTNRKKFTHYTLSFKPNKLFNENVRALFEDSDGNIWIGTKDKGGLSEFNKKSGEFINYPYDPDNPNGLKDDYIFSINEYDNRYLLIGTYKKGLTVFDKKSQSFSLLENSNVPITIPTIHKDIKGRIWLTTYDSLYTYNHQQGTATHQLRLQNITTIYNEDENNLWLGTQRHGLFLYNTEDKSLENFLEDESDSNSICGNWINSLCKDTLGNIWIGTKTGISKLNIKTRTFTNYTTHDGLLSNTVNHILAANNNTLWLSTAGGLTCYDPIKGEFTIYDVNDGLKGNDFTESVGIKTMDGELLFGGSNGFVVFKPEEIFINASVPLIALVDFKLFNKPVIAGQPDSVLSKHISITDKVTLNHKQRVFTIDFVAINYTLANNVQYAYMLEGLETDWNYVGSRNSATYTNLEAGEYLFKVKAKNRNGGWNIPSRKLSIIVLPPYWKTWWFRIGFALLVVCIISIGFIFRLNQLKKQKEQLEKKVLERTSALQEANKTLEDQSEEIASQRDGMRIKNEEILTQSHALEKLNEEIQEANKLKLRFFTNISHEFRTPLTLIISPLEKILGDKSKVFSPEDWELFQVMKRNSQRLLYLINRLMDFRKLEQGKMILENQYLDIVSFISGIKYAFEDLAHQQDIKFTIDTDVPELIMSVDPDKLEMVFYNLLSNAFKFTPQKGEIGISLSLKYFADKEFLKVIVSDTGAGINPEHKQTIFERFAQLENSEQHKLSGSGIGLALAKDLIELHSGDISVQSELNKGSTFIIRLPLDGMSDSSGSHRTAEKISKVKRDGSLSYLNKEKLELLKQSLVALPQHRQNEMLDPGKELEQEKQIMLIVDDNSDIRQIILQEFKKDFNVLEAADGLVGFSLADKFNPSVIISDVIMPEVNGMDFCKLIKSNLATSHIPVILLTAYASDANHIEGLDHGADDYVAKPFNMELLRARVKSQIDSRERLREKFNRNLVISPKEISVNNLDEKFLKQVVKTIEDNMSDSGLSVDKICSEVGISSTHLHRKLKSLIKLNASNFIRSMRMKRAAQLLESSDLRISEIQDMIGYESRSAFINVFRKEFGLTPTDYAKAKASNV